MKEGNIILTGQSEKDNGLWREPLENKNTQMDIEHNINSAYYIKNKTDLVKYLHEASIISVNQYVSGKLKRDIYNNGPELLHNF